VGLPWPPAGGRSAEYNNTWASLDSRPNPSWWSEIKFSVSLHWGVYSVPAYSVSQSSSSTADPTQGTAPYAEWYWHNMGGPTGPDNSTTGEYHRSAFGADFTYEDFASQFRAELYNDAADWADLFKASGVQAAVLTSKHHDGYELWPSPNAYSWNSVDVGPKQDLVGAFLKSIRAAGMHAGLYHSVFEWFNPLYRGSNPEQYVDQKLIPDLHQIVTDYAPDVLLMDGEWEHPSDFWKTRDFLAWLFNESPIKDTVVVDDRWGSETRGKHGGVFVCENGMFSPFCDGAGAATGQVHDWMYWATQARSWGMSRTEDDSQYKGAAFFVPLLTRTAAGGGSLMVNLGPTSDGRIPAMQSLTLREMGDWLNVNGAAIFNTTARPAGARSEVTAKADTFGVRRPGFTTVANTPPGGNGGTASISYHGTTASATACQAACTAETSCLAYTWYDDTAGPYATMCYFQNATGYTVLRQATATSGFRDFVEVHYTAALRSQRPTLNAIVRPFPIDATLTLSSVLLPPTGKVTLLGLAPPANGTLPFWSTSGGTVIAVPPIAPGQLPCEHAFTFVLEGVQ